MRDRQSQSATRYPRSAIHICRVIPSKRLGMTKAGSTAVSCAPIGHNTFPLLPLFCRASLPMSDPANSWLAAQREVIERWLAAPPTDAARDQVQQFWQSIADGVSPQARELAQQLSELGPRFLAGAGDALFDLFGASRQKGNETSFGRWLDLAPVGYFREHHAHAQELGLALEEYRRIASR